MDQNLNLDAQLCEKFAAYLESNDEARLAAIIPAAMHQGYHETSVAE